MKLIYVTIRPEDRTLEDIVAKIQRESQISAEQLKVSEYPFNLVGMAKVLTLRPRKGDKRIRVDGPGFLIDQLYRHFR